MGITAVGFVLVLEGSVTVVIVDADMTEVDVIEY